MSETLDSLGRRIGIPRKVGMKPTKRYWDEASAKLAWEMKARGCPTAEIASCLERDPQCIRNFFNRGKDSPSKHLTLAERDKGMLLKRCRKCEIEKPLDDFAINRSKANGNRRWPYCKPCEIARLSDRRDKGLHLEKMRRHIAKHREKYPEQAAVNRIFGAALRYKRIIRPDTCEICGQKPAPNRLGRSSIQGHHDDYSKPLEVHWFCQPCHIEHHRKHPNV